MLNTIAERIMIGARWDDASQDERFAKAQARGLLDYIEVNYPISAGEDPFRLEIPVLAHSSNNPVASVHGLDPLVASAVKSGADKSDCPWVGEHLAWLGFAPTGALGYVLNPLFTEPFCRVAAANAAALQSFYGRPLALELGPVYTMAGDFSSEMHFLGAVADRADTHVILDVTHWTISNKNLRRPDDYGLSAIAAERVIELHVAGMRKSASSDHWHDAHGVPVAEEILDHLKSLVGGFPNLRAVTLEHSMEGSEADFLVSLERLHNLLR